MGLLLELVTAPLVKPVKFMFFTKTVKHLTAKHMKVFTDLIWLFGNFDATQLDWPNQASGLWFSIDRPSKYIPIAQNLPPWAQQLAALHSLTDVVTPSKVLMMKLTERSNLIRRILIKNRLSIYDHTKGNWCFSKF
jgi:hypothetical protein